MHLELIKWNDAWAASGNKRIADLECEPYVTYTVGWVVQDNKKGVMLTPEYWPEDSKKVSGVTFIPRGMIESRQRLGPEVPSESTPASVVP
jgi:hypothetical protein